MITLSSSDRLLESVALYPALILFSLAPLPKNMLETTADVLCGRIPSYTLLYATVTST